jgi:hypothetical protein
MPAIRKENKRLECHPTVPWTQTLCSTISEGGCHAEHGMFHKAVSFVVPNSNKVANNTHIIFRAPSNGKVSSLCDLSFDCTIYRILAFNWTGERDTCTSGWFTTTCYTYCHSAPRIPTFSPSDISSSLSQAH